MSEGAAAMSAPPLDTPLGSLVSIPVLPGQKVIIPLDQTAPMEPGWYRGAWGLNTSSGEAVTITHGTDVDSTASFYVDIVVKTDTPTPTPISTLTSTLTQPPSQLAAFPLSESQRLWCILAARIAVPWK